ncbi:murein hydrolase activator EnvC [Massilia sp. TS11]|uniref:murein hydrolase activator EnvC family protein n=1 Tax=Massilia sp. TS11 TaxID=2908003 RepID=UPI001EDA88DD|nr:peptidoglycan DD-metalloendopeptidase family protein [Massilia sp. TS11]MCG2585852.1 peptidoglycan DD-metalloendopeptidase family protein [Massilia sp. TS11]
MRRALWLASLALVAGAALAAPKPTERSKQKLEAEAQRKAIAQRLAALNKDISKTESEKDAVADQLAEAEESISDAIRNLRDLQQEQAQTNAKLKDLAESRTRLAAQVEAQKAQIAKLLREHYVAGNEDRIKLLLSGDNPNRINRDLQLMAYVSQAQGKLLEALRTNLATLEQNQAETEDAKASLEEIVAEQKAEKDKLEKDKARRKELLGKVNKKLVAQKKQAVDLEKEDQRMQAMINQLAELIRKQNEAAAAEKKRQEALAVARAKAEAEARAKAEEERKKKLAAASKPPSTPGKPAFKPTPIDDVEPPKPVAKKEPPKPDPDAPNPADVALATVMPPDTLPNLKGQMKLPVAGKVVVKFGQRVDNSLPWKGLFIKAPEGAEVHAVAPGKVIFAERQGFLGNTIIIDHGGDYWSVYAYNQALLKRKGDIVKAGEAVALVGNTGSMEDSGLYFDLRRKYLPFDPAGWVKF